MEGFKPVIKMKTGGSVSKAVAAHEKKEMAAEKKGMHTDIVEDKKLVKKAINIHDDQLHEGAKTDLSKLKKGGRCKKTNGTVRKYNCGGGVKKMADGNLTAPLATANQAAGVPANPVQNAAAAALLKRKLAAQAAGQAGNMGGGMGALQAAQQAGGGIGGGMAVAPTPQNIGTTTGPIMKKGGKVKKDCK